MKSKTASIAIEADLRLAALPMNVILEIRDLNDFDVIDVTLGETSLIEHLCDHQVDKLREELHYAIQDYIAEQAEWEEAALEDYQDGLAEEKKLLH